jgi:hypothetical protein
VTAILLLKPLCGGVTATAAVYSIIPVKFVFAIAYYPKQSAVSYQWKYIIVKF